MLDVVLTCSITLAFALLIAKKSRAYPGAVRPWLYVAFVEYAVCGIAEYNFAVDASRYRRVGIELAQLLDASFSWAAPELLLLLFQQPSSLDRFVVGAGTNTGSISAASAVLMFIVRGSSYAAHALVTGLSLLAAMAVFRAFRHAVPHTPPVRLFAATVLFPSIAFWTASLHKESFCLMGLGLTFQGWRTAQAAPLRAMLAGSLGLIIIALFRAPVLPPLLAGLLLYTTLTRIKRVPAARLAIAAPLYLGLSALVLAFGMLLLTRASPELALDQLTESVAEQQQAWSVTEGGSSLDIDAPIAQSAADQLASAPFALFNALLRPQLFDVTNPLVLGSAIEMTMIAWLLVQTLRTNGLRGLLSRVASSPFLLMCTVVTLIGCTFVGLTTRNLGSMARYRVPFLPFYGALLAVLTHKLPAAPIASESPRRRASRTALARRRASGPPRHPRA